ncbi:MAG: helix-turn-helix domain-containing protein [Desulfarculaceae bacterium]|nr:helix-turn-helix domain-containing protein [Desulfarculaceae bacterium]MCF8047766.1 helix-turn-helix domain-containing protein [Desulfarculaceae bacterium]MCF8066896.1 helix-turn-helix domain-containing protein [Desulfarculaceae bacterium]MCF8098786.1 helix-turn-helix domain-containing protein [Desulfarculaceae bacterium]
MGIVAEQFGARLRALRNAAFLTQEELAKKAGISTGQIVRYEAGKNIPREAIQLSLAEALGVSPLDFYVSGEPPVFNGDEQNSAAVANRIGERIRKLCKEQDIEPAFLYRTVGDVGYWSSILHGKKLPTAVEAPKIAEALGVKTPDLFGTLDTEEKMELDRGGYVLLPLQGIRATRKVTYDEGDSLSSFEQQLFNVSWINFENDLKVGNLLLVPVIGDAMVPSLNPGDLVLVDKTRSHVPDDGLYALSMDGDMLIKRLRKRPGRKVQVISDNEVYGSFEFDLASPPEEMSVVGRVIWMGRKA